MELCRSHPSAGASAPTRIKGGEAEVMRLIGERPPYEGDVELGLRQSPPRQPWV